MQQNCSVEWTRIRNLLRYDWAIDKSKITNTLVIILGLYTAFFLMAYWNQTRLGDADTYSPEGGANLATFATVSVMNYFQYATMVVLILATVILHRKFTNPQTSVQYLALPGSRLEKYIVMLADYAIVFVGMEVLYLAVWALSMLVCQLTYPEISWWLNPYGGYDLADRIFDFTQSHSTDSAPDLFHTNTMQLFFWISPFINLVFFGLWTNVNMLFSHNGILKTIGLFILAYVVLLIGLMFFFVGFFATIDHDVETLQYYGHLGSIAIKVFLWFQIPLALFLQWLFYRQIAKKQAK